MCIRDRWSPLSRVVVVVVVVVDIDAQAACDSTGQRRRFHRIIGGGHKGRLGVWGTEVPLGGPGRSPGKGSSSPEAEAFL